MSIMEEMWYGARGAAMNVCKIKKAATEELLLVDILPGLEDEHIPMAVLYLVTMTG
jgi:hypothetical protein